MSRWWRPTRPGLAVNLHGSGPESHRRLRALRPGALWAFANRAAGHHDGPGWIDDEHEVRRWCRLVRYCGVACDESDLDLHVPGADVPARATIIHPGANSPARRWPPDRFASVACRLVTAGHHVLVTGSPQEHDLCVRVAELANLPPEAVPRTGPPLPPPAVARHPHRPGRSARPGPPGPAGRHPRRGPDRRVRSPRRRPVARGRRVCEVLAGDRPRTRLVTALTRRR